MSTDLVETAASVIISMQLPHDITTSHINKLLQYKYVEEICDLKCGAYIKWILLTNPSKISSGGIVCDVKITDKGMVIACKNFIGRFFQIYADNIIIFQKMSDDELIISGVLDFIHDKNDYK